MQTYYRITAYHNEKDYSIIIDACNLYDAIWKFSVDLMKRGYTIVEASKYENIREINMEPCLHESDNSVPFLRCWGKGKPVRFTYEANGRALLRYTGKRTYVRFTILSTTAEGIQEQLGRKS